MDIIKLAVLNRLQRDIEDTAEIETAVKGTDDIYVYYSGERISLDREILEYARKYYNDKLNKLKKEFEEA
jgi:hypothetical protein